MPPWARLIGAGVNLYLVPLIVWSVLWFVAGERIALIQLAAQGAVWLFVLVPVAAVYGVLTRNRFVLAGSAYAIALFLFWWAGLFIPRAPAVSAGTSSLVVMTYNALGPARDPNASVAVIRAASPDLVAIQELNNDLARALQTELRSDYPYQILDPDPSVFGMGVISRFPIRLLDERLPPPWVGVPQLLKLDWNGRSISVLNFHTWPPNAGDGSYGQQGMVFDIQRQQGEHISAYGVRAAREGPVIALGDANGTEQSGVHRRMVEHLDDSWREAGWGLGHTWGGSALPRMPFGPLWIARIDYVLHSKDLVALAAHVAEHDGISDHRGVVVRLAPRQDGDQRQ